MSDEIQLAQGENQPKGGNLPEGIVPQEEIRIDVYDADVIKNGRIGLNFDPYMAQYIVTTDMDLLVVTAEGQTITLANYTDAVSSGFLNGIEVPGGGTFEADSVLEIAQTVDDLTAALAEYETATGDSNLTQASGGFGGFSRLEIQSLGGLATSEGEEGPLAVAATQTENLVSKFVPLEERSSIRFAEAEEIAGPVDLTASAPTLILSGSAAGQEDGAIPLDIAAALTDRDGSETLTLTISGLPEGAALSAGTVNPDGTVTLAATDLPGLTVTPPSFSNDDFSLTVTATSTERASGATADVIDTVIVQVTGVANAPALTAADSAGIEDTAIGLDIESALVDMDGSETLAIELSGIPDGAVLLSDGVPVTVVGGIAQLAPDQLDNLTITPPANSSADFQLTVSATATEADGDTATTTSTINVAIASEADAPTLTASDATARYGDAGADVMTGGAGDDVLTGAGGSDTIRGGDGDDILVGDGDNKMPIAAVLDINAALGSDADEVLTITVSGLPAGAALTAGVVNADGSVTLTPEEASGVIITVAPGTPDFDLTVTATSTDSDSDGGSSSVSETTVITVAVDETNIADADYLDGGAGADILLGGSGDDVLLGGTGDDTINTGTAGETGDFVEAGAGDDAIIYTVQDGVGMTQIDGGADFDTLQLNLTGIQFIDPDIQTDLRALQTYLENGETGPIVLNALNLIAENIEAVDLRVDGSAVDFDVKADAASLTTENATGDENTAIALSLDAALTDTDGSETMSIELSGIPEGAVLKSGDDIIDTTDGTAILTADQLTDLTITPAADDRSDFSLSVSVTTTETLTGHTETVDGTIDVTVTGVANEASLVVSDASGAEDQAIDLSVAVGEIQAGDTASITISGVPDGATLSAGTVNPDGSVTLTTNELTGLTITPAVDSSDDFNLTVTVTTTDNESGDIATTTGSIAVSVAADADAPTLTVNDASGNEDQAIALDLSAALTDASESLSITISDIPDGATLSAGTVNDDGSVTLTADQLDGLTITPAANYSSDFTLSVTATSTDGEDTATTTGSIAVSVAADADAPTLTVNDASGTEDQAIALDLSAALTDASENLSVTISEIPAGATLSAGTVNDDGSVTLTADQLNGLTITPAANDSSDFTLAVTATSTDGDDTATTTGSVSVSIAADADAPTLTVNDAAGTEDQAIALDLSAALTDASETLSITISDIPNGATLSAGTVNPDGSVTLTADQLDGLTITPAANDSSDFTLAVTATSMDGDDTATTTGSIAVSVAADADAPTLTVNDASGTEDQAIALDLSAALTDASESLSITISDIPAGATLSAGTVNPDGSVTLTADQLEGLTITPAANDSSDFTLAVTATSTDGDDTATTTGSIAVSVAADADAPTLTVNDASGTEDQAIALDLSAALTDDSEALSITISDIPAGTTLSAGTVNPDGSVTLTADQLEGLTITPAANDSSDFTLSVAATSTDGADTETVTSTIDVSVSSVADAPTLTVSIGEPQVSYVTDGDGGTGDIPVDTNAAVPTSGDDTITLDNMEMNENIDLQGGNDTLVIQGDLAGGNNINLNDGNDRVTINGNINGNVAITGGNGQDIITFGKDSTTYQISNLTNNGGTISAQVRDLDTGKTVTINNVETISFADGVVVGDPSLVSSTASSAIVTNDLTIDAALTDTDGSESLTIQVAGVPDGAQLSAGTDNGNGVWTLQPADLEGLQLVHSGVNAGEPLNLTITATSQEADGDIATTTQTASTESVDTGLAEAATVYGDDATGTEDTAIALTIDVSNVQDSDTASITISDIPAGATLSAGTVNSDGSVTLTVDQLEGLTITPAANDSNDFTLAIDVTTTDTVSGLSSTVSDTLGVSVAADADAPTLTVNDTSGTEDQAIAMDLSATLTDASESLSITISDIPAGATLSAGTVNPDGSVTLTADQLEGLTITPAANDSSDFTLSVTATSTDGDDTATTTGSIAVSVSADADAPTLTVSVGAASLHTTEGSTTAVAIDSANASDTGSGFTISTRTLDANENLNDASTGNISFNNDPPGFGVSGQASGDQAEIGFNNATGVSEQLIVDFAHDATSVDVAFSWLASNETAKYELYKDGVKVGEGTYTGITDDVDDAITLTATDGAAFDRIVFQGAGTEGDFLINSIEATIGEPGETMVEIPLSISATLTDASETLANISISDLPEGAVLTNTAGDTITITDGAASLGPDQLAGLTLTVPQASGNFELQVTAGSIDGGDTATTTSTISIDMPDASTPELTVELGEGTVNNVDSGGPLGDIAITNANFEADSLGDGDYNYDLAGWVESGDGVAGAWDTTGYNDSYSQEEGAHEGEQAAWLQDAAISQTLNATFEADRLYTLNVDVGDSKMQDNVQYSIKIFAGNQLIGTVTEADFPTVNDAFTTATLVVDGSTFASNFSGFGENLRIELATTGDAQAHFDSVAMSAEAVPGAGPEASTTYPLDITASVAATDADDTLSVSVGNIPDGTTFTNAAGDTFTASDGVLTLTAGQLDGLSMTVPNTQDTDIDLTVTATATDPTGLTAQTTNVVSLDIDPSSQTGVDIAGTTGDDLITGSSGDDSLSGGDGDDTIIGGDGSDRISGGSGNDTIYGDRTDGSGSGTTQVTLLDASISSGSGNFSEDFTYSDNVFGTNDSGSASGRYDSNDGADGGGALEVKLGSLSDGDTTSGASGGWTTSINVANATTDTVLTFSYRLNFSSDFESDEFADVLVSVDGSLQGSDGNNYVARVSGDGNGGSDFDSGWQTVTLNLGTLEPGTHEITLGGYLNKATADSENLELNFDNISLVGTTLGSDDTIDGGSGDDVIFADDGNDVIDGGDGTDTIDFSNADSGVTLDFANGTVTGGSDNDTISNVENAVGSDHADTLTGDDNDNVLQGGGGDDTLDGGAGNDTVSYEDASGSVTVDLANGTVTGADGNDIVSNFENVTGSAHADTIIGDGGDNIINGGGGADNLTGGGGADTFKFSLLDGAADTITDFSIADGDKLDVSDLVNVEDNDAISNFVRITEDDSGNSVVQVDTSGSGEDANFEDVAVLEGVTGLDINDVIDTGANNPDAV
ncbi:MAG: type I secretion C-terminal target domain-containing protein [Alphaproteobacteria bacterium]